MYICNIPSGLTVLRIVYCLYSFTVWLWQSVIDRIAIQEIYTYLSVQNIRNGQRMCLCKELDGSRLSFTIKRFAGPEEFCRLSLVIHWDFFYLVLWLNVGKVQRCPVDTSSFRGCHRTLKSFPSPAHTHKVVGTVWSQPWQRRNRSLTQCKKERERAIVGS